ncbi:MAG: LPXTG cell wall anchor domain-containing protein, partial [Oscillospiraceae bacterium]|nr:LPXTG cell wall anchor domain-containing protein [Oscillospiraceae bacterium]
TYGLLETKAPTGYNLMKDPIIITLTGSYDGTNAKVTTTNNSVTITNGTIAVGADQHPLQPVATACVNNQSGTQLPSTGGIGTTIFYVVGGVLVLAAIILLVTKKRMSE